MTDLGHRDDRWVVYNDEEENYKFHLNFPLDEKKW